MSLSSIREGAWVVDVPVVVAAMAAVDINPVASAAKIVRENFILIKFLSVQVLAFARHSGIASRLPRVKSYTRANMSTKIYGKGFDLEDIKTRVFSAVLSVVVDGEMFRHLV